MDNEKENEELTPAVTEETAAELEANVAEFLETDFGADLKNATEGITLTKNYLEFKKAGDSRRLVFLGMGDFVVIKDNNKQTFLIANFADQDGKLFFSRGVKIVQDCQGLPQFTMVEITYDGSEDLTGGKTMKHYTTKRLNKK